MNNSQEVASLIKSFAKSKRITISLILEECKLGSSTISKMSNGTDILSKSLAKIANYLDCSIDYLLGRTDNPDLRINNTTTTNFLTQDELELLTDYASLSTQGKDYIKQSIKMAKHTNNKA